jgi:antirestriction protein ArdC
LTDSVQIPKQERFESAESYYATLFHELAHSTGHSKRLDRGLDKKLAPFGSSDYSKEELVAELGAAFLAATAGISPPTIEQSAAYIDNWRKKLRGDKKMIVQAAGAGQRAADHILGVTWDESNDNARPPPSADQQAAGPS